MSIKCGSCGDRHESVFAVKECYATAKFAAETEASHEHFLRTGCDDSGARGEEFLTGARPTASVVMDSLRRAHVGSTVLANRALPVETERWATDAMEKFASDLVRERDSEGVDVEVTEAIMHKIEGKRLYFREAKLIIEALKNRPKTQAVKNARDSRRQEWRSLAEQLEDGNYALPFSPVKGGQDKTHFYRLTKRDGRTPGKQFISLQERASDGLFPVELGSYKTILQAIVDFGAENAGRLFAERLGSCRKCGRSLTDEHNPYRAQGYGPDCGAKA